MNYRKELCIWFGITLKNKIYGKAVEKGGFVHYERDYREQVAKENEELEKLCEGKTRNLKENALAREELSRIIEISEMKASQYRKVHSKKLCAVLLEGFYELENQARIQGGKVVLDISEDKMNGTLTYTGTQLIQTGAFGDTFSKTFAKLLVYFPDIWLKAEDNEFTLTIQARLYKEVRIKNLSREIERKQMELRKWTHENYLYK